MAWPCFWVEPTGEAEQQLRRFTLSEEGIDCASGYHQAVSFIGRAPELRDENGFHHVSDDEVPHDDPRWPSTCELCGRPFEPGDYWQVSGDMILRRPDTGEDWSMRNLPVGAMFDGFWNPAQWKGDDGMAVLVVLPPAGGGDARSHLWNVDGPSNSLEGGLKPHAWARTGDPKAVPATLDVNPSILVSDYHGFLRLGVLSDPL